MSSYQNVSIFVIIAVIFSGIFIGCSGQDVEEQVQPELVTKTDKTPTKTDEPKGDPTISWKGGAEELWTSFSYPAFWKLNVVPGIKKTPGIDKPESHYCVFNLTSLDARIVITVKEGTSDLQQIVEEAKNKIFSLYPESYFNLTPPKLVKIGDVNVEDEEGNREVRQADMPKNDGKLPHFEGTPSYVQTDDYNYEEGSGPNSTSLPSEVFKRNEVWKDGAEKWQEVKPSSREKIDGVMPIKYEGEFIYDQNLFYVVLRAANVKDKTVYGLYICPMESYTQYTQSFYYINSKIKFAQ